MDQTTSNDIPLVTVPVEQPSVSERDKLTELTLVQLRTIARKLKEEGKIGAYSTARKGELIDIILQAGGASVPAGAPAGKPSEPVTLRDELNALRLDQLKAKARELKQSHKIGAYSTKSKAEIIDMICEAYNPTPKPPEPELTLEQRLQKANLLDLRKEAKELDVKGYSTKNKATVIQMILAAYEQKEKEQK